MANQVVNLKSGSNYLFPRVIGVDTTDIIKQFSSTAWVATSYTATKDCCLIGTFGNKTNDSTQWFSLDNVPILYNYDTYARNVCLYMHKGQTIYVHCYVHKLVCYGLKYN